MKKHFVSKYKYSHDKRRKQFRKWCLDGLVKKLESTKDGFLYQELKDHPISTSGNGHKKRFKIKEAR